MDATKFEVLTQGKASLTEAKAWAEACAQTLLGTPAAVETAAAKAAAWALLPLVRAVAVACSRQKFV